MGTKELHPSVQKFKDFVKKHPKIMEEVRKGGATLQELYEDWYLLGEEDSRWDMFIENGDDEKESDNKGNKEMMSAMLKVLKNLDSNQVQGYIANLSQALGAIQGVISQFQGGDSPVPQKSKQQNEARSPFQFRKD